MRTKMTALLLVLLLVVLTACGGAQRDDEGTITGEGDLDVFTLTVGDCFSTDSDADEITSVGGVPCDQAHNGEVFALVDYPADGSAEWPGQDALDAFSDEGCVAEFEDYVGLSYNESRLGISYLQPTEGSWSDGDREVVCLVVDPEAETTTGSLRDANE